MGTVYLLGLDIGTSGCKGVLVDIHGNIKASLTTRHSISQPQPGWAEHDPEKNWWDEMVTIIKHCLTTSGINLKILPAFLPVAVSPTFALLMRKVIQFVPLFFTGIIGQLWKPKS